MRGVSALAFSMLKFIGAGYLVYLAWHAFHASADKIKGKAGENVDHWRLYWRGTVFLGLALKLATTKR